MRKTPPLVRFSGLSGEIYCLTRYRVKGIAGGRKVVVASEKFDVTAEVEAAMQERSLFLLKKVRPSSRSLVRRAFALLALATLNEADRKRTPTRLHLDVGVVAKPRKPHR